MSPPKSSPRNPDNAGVLSPSVGQEPGLRHWPGRWWPSSYWGAELKILSPSGDALPKSTGKHRYFSTDLAGAVSKGQIEHCTQVSLPTPTSPPSPALLFLPAPLSLSPPTTTEVCLIAPSLAGSPPRPLRFRPGVSILHPASQLYPGSSTCQLRSPGHCSPGELGEGRSG